MTRFFALACLLACATVPQPRPTPAVEGIAVGPDGKAVAGATVAAVRYGNMDPSTSHASALSVSGADGRFRLEGLPDGTYGFTATAADLTAAYAGEVEVIGGRAPSALRLVLGEKEGEVLAGVARDGEGKPVAGAEVRALRMSDVDGDVFFARAGADGSYRMSLPGTASYLAFVAVGDRILSQSTFAADPGLRRPPPAEVVEWLRARAIPLTTVEAGHGFADMAPLRNLVGDAHVVALGEATHGTREFFQLKHRMLEFLVSEMGFTVFAIEGVMPEAFDVNEYVLTGKGDPAQALSALYFWAWDTEEVLDLIRWMRRWNADPAHPRKVKFYGLDMQLPERALRVAADYLRQVDPERAARMLAAVSPVGDPIRYVDLAGLPEASRQTVAKAVAELVAAFDEHRADWSKRTGADAWAQARQHARIAQQYAEIASATSTDGDVRDRSMAENVRWIRDREGPGTRMVLWAHNGHVFTSGGPPDAGPLGAQLRRELGADLVVFGFAFDRGAFRARDRASATEPLRSFTVTAAPVGSLDGALAATGLPLAAVDLRPTPEKKGVAEWLAAPHATRNVGASFSEDDQHCWIRLTPRSVYDALLFVRETTAARSNPSGKRLRTDNPLAAPRNLDFEESKPGDPPEGWVTVDQFGFQIATVDSGCASGKRCAVVRRKPGSYYGETSGRLAQLLDAAPYRGKRVRVHAETRVVVPAELGRAELYARASGNVPNPQDTVSAYRDIGGDKWQESMLEIDVPADAQRLSFGIGLSGVGEASIDAVSLEIVPPAR